MLFSSQNREEFYGIFLQKNLFRQSIAELKMGRKDWPGFKESRQRDYFLASDFAPLAFLSCFGFIPFLSFF
jgi:hypothetical protein